MKAEGHENGVYIRLGSTNRRAGPEILADLQRYMAGLSYDQIPCPDTSTKDLDMDKALRMFAAVGRRSNESKLESLGVMVPHAGRLVTSHGGLILFGRDSIRERFFPDARVSCARFRGIDKTKFIDRIDIAGSILDAVEEVPKFIRRNTRLAAKIESIRRFDIPEYPETAIREVLVNAIVHADYSLTGMRILVAIYSNRMEIQNPGMLPFGMTMDQLRSGVSKIRNRVIARVFRELEWIEEWGSGYKRVTEACRTGGYPDSHWEELGAAFRVVFYPHPDVAQYSTLDVPVNVPVNERQKWFLEQLASKKQTRASDVVIRWEVSEKTAKRDIADLKARGVVEFVGAPKKGIYRIRQQT